MPKISAEAVRPWRSQFRVTRRILGEFVMCEMVIAKPRWRQKEDKPDNLSNPVIDTFAAKRCSMRCLVHERKPEGQKDTLRDERQRPSRRARQNEPAHDCDQERMCEQMPTRIPVGQPR